MYTKQFGVGLSRDCTVWGACLLWLPTCRTWKQGRACETTPSCLPPSPSRPHRWERRRRSPSSPTRSSAIQMLSGNKLRHSGTHPMSSVPCKPPLPSLALVPNLRIICPAAYMRADMSIGFYWVFVNDSGACSLSPSHRNRLSAPCLRRRMAHGPLQHQVRWHSSSYCSMLSNTHLASFNHSEVHISLGERRGRPSPVAVPRRCGVGFVAGERCQPHFSLLEHV